MATLVVFHLFRRGFGGKFGELLVEKLGVEFMADLCKFSETELEAILGERAT